MRGGTYCKLELNEDQKRALEIENAGSKDLCYYCKKKGHFMAQCEEKYEEEEQEEEYEYFCEMCEECGEEFDLDYGHHIALNLMKCSNTMFSLLCKVFKSVKVSIH